MTATLPKAGKGAAAAGGDRGEPRVIKHYIAGELYAGPVTRWGDVCNPATGEVAAGVTYADADVVERAVSAAAQAFPAWRDTPIMQRVRIMFRFRELVERNTDELARLITLEHGKVTSDAQAEVARGLEVVDFACGIPQLLKGEHSEHVSTGIDTWSTRQPLGVVAGITPFNFPAMVPMWMFPVAVACGNTFVLKPSEKDPSAATLLAQLFSEAGAPAGVLNVVHGDREAVDALLLDDRVAAISSVTSTPVARHIYCTAARHGKRVQALGGAKNHMVVLPDADLDAAADAAVSAGFGSAGQRCMAVSVVVAVGDCADGLVARITRSAKAIRVGAGTDPDSEMGPLVEAAALARVREYIERGTAEGASLVLDGRDVSVAEENSGGFFVGPTLFDNVTADMSIYTDEIFGPLLCVVRVDTLDEAMALVNAHEYANGVALFTHDGPAARRFQREIEVGMVGINVPIPVPMAFHSFGGWRSSLFGDTHMHGTEGVRFCTRAKVVTTRWPETARGVNLQFPTTR